jgi:hypothetical protein
MLGRQQRGFQVHPQDVVEGIGRYIYYRRVTGGQTGTDVVMQDVDAPEQTDAAGNCLRHGLFVGRVRLYGRGPASRIDDLPGSLLGSREIAVDRNDGRPFPAEQERRSPAVPDSRSGGLSRSHDEGYAIFEQHGVQFSF